MRVFLVRHADAGDREDWRGDDRDRPLSEKGWAQARGLVEHLGAEQVGAILSSPYLRCVQTVEPAGAALGIEVEPEDALQEGADWHKALGLVLGVTVPTVMCSQGDVIGSLVMEIVRLGIAGRDARWQKGSTWVLDVDSRTIQAARYLPPQRG